MIYDAVVLGLGSMGSSALFYLSQQGLQVLGIDQFTPPHEFGSHTGQSRIIRKAYFEHPDYVPLLERAYANWKFIENLASTKLYFETGFFYAATPDSALLNGVRQSALLYNIPLLTSQDQIQKQYGIDSIYIPNHFETLLEPEAGFLKPEACIETYCREAVKRNATIVTNEKIISWNKVNDLFYISTTQATYRARKLVITTGAWTSSLIPQTKATLRVTRQCVIWVQPSHPERFQLGNFPCWTIADEQHPGIFYGFPILNEKDFGKPTGLKFAHHAPGETFNPENPIPLNSQQETEKLKSIFHRYFHERIEEVLAVKSCLYTYSPDENFIIDFLHNDRDAVFACGFSGHGFKFASVVGEILSDLVVNGRTSQPIDFLRLKRFN